MSSRAHALAITVVLVGCLLAPASAAAFDTGPHSDITRDALTAEGFGSTASDVANVNNWFVDLYSNASKIPQSGHASIFKGIVGSLLGPRENWNSVVVDSATRTHFDSGHLDIKNAARVQLEWDRLSRSTALLARDAKAHKSPLELLTVIGMSLHELQDFYAHSNWIEEQGLAGVDGPNWATMAFGTTPTWYDVPAATRSKLNVYIGETTGHKRTHGAWNTDGNKTMKNGVNKDWPGRPGYTNAYLAAYFATRQWVQAIRTAVGDDAFWGQALRFGNSHGSSLSHDLRGALQIGITTGHWQGQGEPCNPELSLSVCGSRNGPGGDLIGARSAVRDYFEDHSKTIFRKTFEQLIPTLARENGGSELVVASSQDMQRSTKFVQLKVLSMRGIDLGDPGPDQADMFTRAIISGQQFQSGEINSHDSYSFPLPNAPFAFIKAVPPSASYREPVTSLAVEIRTSSALYSGTDDDVFLRVSPTLRFDLDKRLYNDFERGDRDTYSVPIDDAARAGLTVGDLTRIQIEKSSDGVAGGWKLRGVKVVVNGRQIYAKDGIERWLEKGNRTWRAPDFRAASPAGTALPVSLDLWDEDSNIFGGNDHGDVNPFDRRKTLTLAYTPGSGTVERRATGGSTLGGRLGDADKATLVYRLETLTPVPAKIVRPPIVQPPPTTTAPTTPPPPPAAKPDLVISAMDWNATDKYFFTVKNQGAAAAGTFTVDVSGYKAFVVPGLAAGASRTESYASACKVGTRTATADSLSQIDESNESNNSRSYNVDLCLTSLWWPAQWPF